MIHHYYNRVAKARFFTDAEAWNLFRLAAFSEAFGWTLLISSLVIKHYITPGNNIPIDIAGQIHGTIFLIYLAGVFVLHPSLKWTPKRTLLAAAVSVPPYGTLIFEQLIAKERRREAEMSYRQINVRGLILNKNKLLAIQLSDSSNWQLPGGQATDGETSQQALIRHIKSQTGVKPKVGQLRYVWEYKKGKVGQLELFFVIDNCKDYLTLDLNKKLSASGILDELNFIIPKDKDTFVPEFIKLANIKRYKPDQQASVVFQ